MRRYYSQPTTWKRRKRGYGLVGDVDFEPVAEKAAAITPVPGGVGPTTIVMLLRSTLGAAWAAVSSDSPSLLHDWEATSDLREAQSKGGFA